MASGKLGELHSLVREGRIDDAKRLVNKEHALLSARDDSGRSLLHTAAVAGAIPLMELAVHQEGLSPESEDDLGWTPLICASSAGQAEAVRFLLSSPLVDVKHRNSNGQTALHYAASKGYSQIVDLLLENGADVNAADKYGATPLHRAASQGRDEVIRRLLAVGSIRADARDGEGNTPLLAERGIGCVGRARACRHLACHESREDAALSLLRAGADPLSRNKEEQRPVDLIKSPAFSEKMHRIYEQVLKQRSPI